MGSREREQAQVFSLFQKLRVMNRAFDGSEELRWTLYYLTGRLILDDEGEIEDERSLEWADRAIEEQYPSLYRAARLPQHVVFRSLRPQARSFLYKLNLFIPTIVLLHREMTPRSRAS